jgi:hypothetical protein
MAWHTTGKMRAALHVRPLQLEQAWQARVCARWQRCLVRQLRLLAVTLPTCRIRAASSCISSVMRSSITSGSSSASTALAM